MITILATDGHRKIFETNDGKLVDRRPSNESDFFDDSNDFEVLGHKPIKLNKNQIKVLESKKNNR